MIEEENKDRPPGADDSLPQSEQLSNASTDEQLASSAEPKAGTSNQQPETEQIMEVHHHAHHEHGKKNWRSYFWEFLMLFLAVFCGFLAEYQLEKTIERHREADYINSYVQDIEKDTANLSAIIKELDQKVIFRDSLLRELSNPAVMQSSSRAFYFFILSYHFPDFLYTDRTIQQLKNSGGMRLIRNKAVSDSMMDYDAFVRTIQIHQDMMNKLSLDFREQNNRLFQKRLLDTTNQGYRQDPVPLLTQSKTDVEEFYNNMSDQRVGFIRLINLDQELLQRGTRLIAFIKEQYKLDEQH